MKYFYGTKGGAVAGPLELGEVIKMFLGGQLSRDVQVCPEDEQAAWQPLETMLATDAPRDPPRPHVSPAPEGMGTSAATPSSKAFFGIAVVLLAFGLMVALNTEHEDFHGRMRDMDSRLLALSPQDRDFDRKLEESTKTHQERVSSRRFNTCLLLGGAAVFFIGGLIASGRKP